MKISAADVMKLRKATNAGMMDCKKALIEAEGDFDKATDIIRKKGLAIAAKRADRDAKEGCVIAKANGGKAIIVSLNCETDFVAKNENFIALTNKIADSALEKMPETIEELLKLPIEDRTIADIISEQTGVIGEKLELSFYGKIDATDSIAYIHPGNKLAAIVGFNKEADNQVMKDVAMQVAAMAPISIDKEDVPTDIREHEFNLGREKAKEEGKPEKMLDKIAEGRLNRFYKDYTLLNQEFIKDNKMNVKSYIQNADKDLKVTKFVRFTLNA